jgi:hypothetical protein
MGAAKELSNADGAFGKNNPSVVLVTYSRPDLLRECLNSLVSNSRLEGKKVIVIWQKGHPEIGLVLSDFEKYIDLLIQVDGASRSTVQNISHNRFLGNSIAFDFYQSPWVLGIEEDVQISNDALLFIEEMFWRYRKYAHFRGVNLGSIEHQSNAKPSEYSLLRFGLHGPASMITRKSWQKFDNSKLLSLGEHDLFDGIFEHYLKTGFMVTPNRSKFLDQGWGGSHTPISPTDRYFAEMQKSFILKPNLQKSDFVRLDIIHFWRYDVTNYRKKSQVLFWIRYWTLNSRSAIFRNLAMSINRKLKRLRARFE